MPDASASLSAGETPAAVRTTTATPPAQAVNRSLADRVLTIGLLGFGLYNVITGIPHFLDYPTFVQQFLDTSGVTATFTNVDEGRTWGLVAAIVFGVLWLATAFASYRQLRRGRLAFWIPLVGAVVAGIVVSFCLAVPLVNDPSLVGVLVPTPTPSP